VADQPNDEHQKAQCNGDICSSMCHFAPNSSGPSAKSLAPVRFAMSRPDCRSLPCNAASEESFGNSAQAAEPSILPDRAANLIGLSRRVARQVQPISDGHGLVFGELLEARSVSRWGRG
jgi:hypothetical protein